MRAGCYTLQLVGTFALILSLHLLLGNAPVAAQGTEADVYVGLAIVAFENKRYDEALQHLQQALALEPENVDALYYTGLTYLAQQKPGSALEYLEQALARNPDDPAILYQLGVTYFFLSEYDKAEPLLTRAFAQQPTLENLGYYVGFIRYRKQDYAGAIEAFNANVTKDPKIQQLSSFYTGLALAISGLPTEALAQVEEARRVPAVSALLEPLERLRDTLVARRERERRLSAQVRFGGYYDTNVAVVPIAKDNDPDVTFLRSRDSNSPGELASVNLTYAWIREGAFESTVGYTFFQTINNDLPNFNIQNHLGSLSGFYRRLLGGMPFQLGTQFSFDRIALRDDRFLDRFTGSLSLTLVENDHNLTSVIGRAQRKNFDSQFLFPIQEEDRDATNWLVGFTHVFRFAQDKHLVRVGYQYDQDEAEGRDWFYRGHRVLTGFQYTLPWGDVRLNYDFSFYYRRYPHPNAIFPTRSPNRFKQEVYEQNHIVRIEKPLPRGFTVAADFQATRSRATDINTIFNYNREVATLSLIWAY